MRPHVEGWAGAAQLWAGLPGKPSLQFRCPAHAAQGMWGWKHGLHRDNQGSHWDPKMPRATQSYPDRALPSPTRILERKMGAASAGGGPLPRLLVGSPTRDDDVVSPSAAPIHKTVLQPKPIWKIPGRGNVPRAGLALVRAWGQGGAQGGPGGHRGESFNGGGQAGRCPPGVARGG